MTLLEIIAALPVDKQAAAKAELDKLEGAVKIASREDAEKLIRDNSFLKSAVDAEISKSVASHDEKFKAEKLPKLVEEELKKLQPPPTDPEKAALAERIKKLEADNLEKDKTAIREKQRARAIGALAAKGLPEKLADFYLGDDDSGTDAKLNMLFEHVIPWKDKAIESTLRERFGNQPTPSGGGGVPATVSAKLAELQKQYADLARTGQMDAASKIVTEMNHLKETAK